MNFDRNKVIVSTQTSEKCISEHLFLLWQTLVYQKEIRFATFLNRILNNFLSRTIIWYANLKIFLYWIENKFQHVRKLLQLRNKIKYLQTDFAFDRFPYFTHSKDYFGVHDYCVITGQSLRGTYTGSLSITNKSYIMHFIVPQLTVDMYFRHLFVIKIKVGWKF